jgi:hypothetical protein
MDRAGFLPQEGRFFLSRAARPRDGEDLMKRTLVFVEGVGAGAGAVLVLGALLFLTRARVVAIAARRIDDASRSGRSPFTGGLPANYLDLCRAAGL